MFQNSEEVIAYITSRTKSRYGLSAFKEYMRSMGNPQYRLPCVHIGGTNGKGSTTDFLRSILQTAGYTVGTFTSPHLESHHDRIRINDVPISDEDLVAYANRYSEDWDKYGITMFEIDMFLSVMYFLEHKADIVLYEVGLGGELDATNIIDPLVSVITTIGYDHMDYLGNTIEEIAGAKAGIIKPNRPLITHERKSSCLQVFEEACKRTNSPMILVQDALDVQTKGTVSFRYGEFGLMHLQSSALYQVDNACNALECVGILRKAGYRISNAQAVSGIEHSMWKGRFEHVDWPGCDVWMDGAHNEHGMQALTKTLKNLNRPMTIVFTALRDKETDKMLEMLLQVSDDVIVTEFAFYRAKKAQDLAKDYPVKVMENWEEAIETALNNNPGTVIITGSLYFISDVRLWFKQKGVLR